MEEFPHVNGYRPSVLNAGNNLASQLASTHPDEAEKILRRNLLLADDAFCLEGIHRNLGAVLFATRRLPEAEAAYREALKYSEKLAAECPPRIGFSSTCLMTCDCWPARWPQISGRQRRTNTYAGPFSFSTNSRPTSRQVPAYRRHLAIAQIEHAGLMKQLGRPAETEEAYRRALDLFVKLSADFPAILEFPQVAFNQRLNLGQFLVRAGRAEDALNVYRQAVDLPGKLAVDVPTKLNHWQGLVRTHVELGRLLLTAGKKQEAEVAFGQAVGIQEKLEKDFAANPEHRHDLASSHTAAAKLLRDAGRAQDAEKVHHLALAYRQKLVAQDPDNLEYLQNLAESYHWLATLLDSGGRVREAEEAFLRAIEIRTKHLVLAPVHVQARLDQGHLHREVAFLRLADQHRSASGGGEALSGGSTALRLRCMPSSPTTRSIGHFLADTHRRLGRILGATA